MLKRAKHGRTAFLFICPRRDRESHAQTEMLPFHRT